MNLAEYRNLDIFSYSAISTYCKSALSYKKKFIDKIKEPKSHKPAMLMGSLIDCLLLTPEEFKSTYIVKDYTVPTGQMKDYVDYLALQDNLEESFQNAFDSLGAKKGNSESFQERFYKEGKGYYDYLKATKMYVTSEEYDKASKTVLALQTNSEIGKLLEGAETQKAFLGDIDGEPFKGLLDIYKKGSIADLKVLSDESPKAFPNKIKLFNYDIQDAVYSELSGENGLNFIAVNHNYPQYPMIWRLSDRDRKFAREKLSRCIKEIRQREESNNWYYPIEGMYGVTNLFGND